MAVRIHPTADVSDKIKIGEGSSLWHHIQVREEISIGKNCVIGNGKRFHLQGLRGDSQGGLILGVRASSQVRWGRGKSSQRSGIVQLFSIHTVCVVESPKRSASER